MITQQMREWIKPYREQGATRAVRFRFPDNTKYAVCPYCEQAWLTSLKGGGMIVAGANRHVKACAKKHGVEV